MLAALAALAGAAVPADAQERLPIFDAHMHYNDGAWPEFPPAEVVEAMDAAGVRWALISSSPDEGTARLLRHAPERFVPALRPYRGWIGKLNWTSYPSVTRYMSEQLEQRPYYAIGEVHIFLRENARSLPANGAARLAIRHGLPLYLHARDGPVRILMDAHPELYVLWAHAGMRQPVGVTRRMLERYDRLCAELSYRADVIAPGGRIDPEWRELFLRYPGRFVVGSDTWRNRRWRDYGAEIEEHRTWLAQLPDEVAERIAWRNGVEMFGLDAEPGALPRLRERLAPPPGIGPARLGTDSPCWPPQQVRTASR